MESPASPPIAQANPPRPWWRWWILLAVVITITWAVWPGRGSWAQPEVPYSTAYGWIDAGKVDAVVLKGDRLAGTLREPQAGVATFQTRTPAEDAELVKLLRARDVTIRVESPDLPVAVQLLVGLSPWLLLFGLGWWLSRRTRSLIASNGPLGGFMRRGKRFERATDETVTFSSVAGLATAKRDLQEIVEFLRDPERARRLGARVPRGILLVGPPGTGKTLLARAVAGEASVPFYSISCSEFIEVFVGVGAARVRELFAEAKRHAPAIVFLDELDAVGRMRGAGIGGGHDEREQTLDQLLSEMDGFDRDTRVIVLAATNRPDVLDAALLRPGRFDRRVIVDLPEALARRAILAVHTADKPLAPDVDLQQLAESTVGFSGADLANLANEAALAATRRRADSITRDDFSSAYDKIVLGDPREGKLGEVERRRVAVHESGHAVVAWFTPAAEPIRRISILPRGMTLGATHQIPVEDRHLHTQPELVARLCVLLGGYAAERAVLGELSTGAEHDLREASRLARRMVARFGMSARLGPVHYEDPEDHIFLGTPHASERATSDPTAHAIEAEVRQLLEQMCVQAAALLEAHRPQLDRLVTALLAHETLERAELEAALGERRTATRAIPIAAPVPPSTTVVER